MNAIGILRLGTSGTTAAAGNDSRITGAAQKASNLSDLADIPTARTNLGLGTAATTAASAYATAAQGTKADTATQPADLAAYALLGGRATPQTIALGTASGATGGYITSTAHATKGSYALNAAGTILVDELNVRFGIGATPSVPLEVNQPTLAGTIATLTTGAGNTNALTPLRIKSVLNGSNYEPILETSAALRITSVLDATSQFRFLSSSGFCYLQNTNNAGGFLITGLNAADVADIYFYATRTAIKGKLFVGGTSTPTARVHIAAGTATAATAPIKLTSGPLLTTAEAGACEFLTDDFFLTITTGAARKGIVLDDGTRLTSGRVPFATTNGRLTDDADMTFSTDTLTVTKIAATTFTGNLTISTKDIITDTTTGTKIATATGQKLGFWGVAPAVQQILATGAGATVDNIITMLQLIGLCKQS